MNPSKQEMSYFSYTHLFYIKNSSKSIFDSYLSQPLEITFFIYSLVEVKVGIKLEFRFSKYMNYFALSEIRSNSAGAVYCMTDRSSLFGSPVPEQDEQIVSTLELPSLTRNKSISLPNEASKPVRNNEEVIVRHKATPAI